MYEYRGSWPLLTIRSSFAWLRWYILKLLTFKKIFETFFGGVKFNVQFLQPSDCWSNKSSQRELWSMFAHKIIMRENKANTKKRKRNSPFSSPCTWCIRESLSIFFFPPWLDSQWLSANLERLFILSPSLLDRTGCTERGEAIALFFCSEVTAGVTFPSQARLGKSQHLSAS